MLTIMILPSIGWAQSQQYVALEPLPCIPGNGVTCTADELAKGRSSFNFQDYIQYIFNLIIAIAAAGAVFMIVFGGLQYMTTDSWQDKKTGLDKVKNAVYGLLLVLCSYLILRTIDPRLVAIPKTLVAPLKINYERYATTADFFAMLETSTASVLDRTKEANRKILADVTVARATAAGLQRQADEINARVATLTGGVDCNDEEPKGDEAIEALCLDRLNLLDQVKKEKIIIAVKVAVGVMNDEIIKCSAGATFETCQRMILAFRTKYNQELDTLSNDPILKTSIDDYARYASVMAYTQSQVVKAIGDASIGPFHAALQDMEIRAGTIIGGVTLGAFGGGVSGGTLAAVGAVAGGNFGRAVVTNILTVSNDSQFAGYKAIAVNNIKNYTSSVIASIRNSEFRQTTQIQIDAMLAGLERR